VNGHGDDGRAEDVVAAIRATGGTASSFVADVTDDAHVTELVGAMTQTLGPIDVLVVNATGPQPGLPQLRRCSDVVGTRSSW
jgi:3-oxoacyl-[acyl-carrier protein] reductase